MWFPLTGTQKTSIEDFSDSLEVRVPSEERLSAIAADERYLYYEEEETVPTLWQRFVMWLRELLGEWVTITWVEWFLKITAAIAFVFVLVLLINQITRGELKNAFMRRKNRTILDLRLGNKEIQNSELDQLIDYAIRNKQFGLAVHYLYQKALFLLRKNDLINWKQDKTNLDYLLELGDHPAASSFDRLTYFHDYVDYGDFPIDEPRFVLVQKVYQQFLDHLEVNK
ncbi:MAG: hypothetical protein MI700_08650 [Balneolales bacterium]|nr:hypothetical protein [Balneolales bacterium]